MLQKHTSLIELLEGRLQWAVKEVKTEKLHMTGISQ